MTSWELLSLTEWKPVWHPDQTKDSLSWCSYPLLWHHLSRMQKTKWKLVFIYFGFPFLTQYKPHSTLVDTFIPLDSCTNASSFISNLILRPLCSSQSVLGISTPLGTLSESKMISQCYNESLVNSQCLLAFITFIQVNWFSEGKASAIL